MLIIVKSIVSGEREQSSVEPELYWRDGYSSDGSGSSQSMSHPEPIRDEIQELFASAVQLINAFELSMVLRNASTGDRYLKATSALPFDSHFDIHYVWHKFGPCATQVEEWLIERLGKANARRRRYLYYCQMHREELPMFLLR
jgi:hypothetical protein